jgi:DNA invertase Pin-like site-specific DNA recombinase
MSEKITPSHLDRSAFVYVRQSTMHQVRNHQESQRRQYALAHRAQSLGFRRVEVIDDDLGRSGSGSHERPGFARLVAAVCTGEVGAVLALEASRLARNNRDWHHLIDLCAMADTLVIDHDGVYDPRLLNDRLLLGLKGTMSEFELGLLNQRAQEALRQMVRRGEVLWQVPIGYVRTEDNRMEMTPDRQVQNAIHGVFEKFCQMGSVRQVLLWYRQNKLPLPTLSADSGKRDVVWRLPIYNRILSILKNPVYAGTFVYGRRRTKTVIVDGRARKTDGHEVPRDQWEVVIPDHHPAYIDWETYLRNQRQIETNLATARMAGVPGSGAAKSGPALLAGLLRCGRCGRKLHVGYSGIGGRVPRYFCRGAHLNQGAEWCISFGGLRVDQAVTTAVLEALEPDGIQAALDAWDQFQQQEDQEHRALRLALEKARYEAERIRRQYDAVEPENRLVASELECRLEHALHGVTELETRLSSAEQGQDRLTEAERTMLLALGEDLPRVWNHPASPVSLKKRILRTVLEEVVVDVLADPPRLTLQLHWAGGVHTPLVIAKNRTGQHRHGTDREVVALVRDLAKVCDDRAITAILNRLGCRTGLGNTWTASRVAALRSHHQIATFDRGQGRPWLTLEEAAGELGVSKHLVRNLINKGVLPARQVVKCAPWVIERESLSRPAIRAAVQAARDGLRGPRPKQSNPQVLLFQEHSEV